MQFPISPIQLIIVCAVVNGFVFAFLLLEKKENRQANRFLSLTILSMCLTFTPFILDVSIWDTYEWLAWLPFSLSYWIGPSFYFYIKSLVTGELFQKSDGWHFAPIVLNYVHSIYHAIVVNSNPWPWFHHIAELFEAAALVSVIIYLVLSYRWVRIYQRSLLGHVSNTDWIDLRWVNQIIFVIAGSCVVIIAFLLLSYSAGGKYSLDQWGGPRAFMLLGYAGILYWLTISGFKQAQTLTIPEELTMDNREEQASEVIQLLTSTISDKRLYRNPQLSLDDLSREVGISQRSISDAINQELEKNFYQFINEYRVEEMKAKLSDYKNDHFKIMSMAIDSGFNSKASFNRVFKQYTGQTPKEYKSKRD